MWNRFSDWIHHVSTGWVALLALVIFVLFLVLVLPGEAARTEREIGDADSPDGSFYYTSEELYEMAEAYGEEGRRAYVRARFTFDLIWPLVYVVFLSAGISWVFRRAFAAGTLWQRANLAPVLGGLFDYLENISTSVVMLRYPDTTPVVASLAGFLTLVKWLFVYGSFVLLVIGVAVGMFRWVRGRIAQ